MKINLKKYLFGLTIALIYLINVQNAQAATFNLQDSGYYFDRNNAVGNDRHSWNWNLYTIDGQIAYCIEPGIAEGNTMIEGNWSNTGLPDSIKERVTLIGYYGYTYPGHQTLKYRAATQGMIWREIVGSGYVNFSTQRWGAGNKLDITAEQAEIERLIAKHYVKPSFNGGTYTLQVGETLNLTDANNVLENYNISVDGADYKVIGNVLSIIPKKIGNITVTMRKKMVYSSNYRIFYGAGIQNMMVAGNTDPVNGQIKLNTYLGKVELNKQDSELGENAQGQATLGGAVYGIYKLDGTLIDEITTDDKGIAVSNAVLEFGSYYLQEIKASNGYHLSEEKIYFDCKGTGMVKANIAKEQVVKNYISILKQYGHVDGTTQFLNGEKDIVFEIFYPDGTKYTEIKTDKNGYATINLPYGVWKFHQANSTTGYEKIYDFFITVDYNSTSEQYYNILNNSLSAYLKVFKKDSETGETIALANTTFKILNTDTNEYVTQYVAGKVYSEFKTDENGMFTTYLKLPAGNYKLIEILSPSGYLKDHNGVNFSIGSDTHYSYTDNGAFITITYKNTPIKGQLEIKKLVEKFEINNGQFTYTNIKLSGVIFEIYAAEDIKSSDGNYLYYKKGTKVDTITTNDNGYAITKKLPLGKYYLIEVKTQEDYVLDNTKHYFNLKEIDDETPIVYESYSIVNHLKKGTLEFTKKDFVDGNVIPNTTIEIYTDKDELIFTGKTDINGKVIIDNLKVGKYYIIEKEAATGYVITREKIYFEINSEGEVVKAEMTNKPIFGSVEITKIDISTGKVLSDTLIEIYDETNNLIFSGRTDKSGKITIDNLKYGKYYFIEKEAPNGYQINNEKMWFEILENGQVVKAQLTNEKIVEVPNTLKNDYISLAMLGLSILGLGAIIYGIFKKKD